MDSLVTGSLSNYSNFKDLWSSLSDKKYNGANSAAAFSIAVYSYTFWLNYDPGGIDPPTPPIAALVWLDFGGAVWGVYSYMYNNWSHHYEEDFGKEMLKNGGNKALESSFIGGFGKFKRRG